MHVNVLHSKNAAAQMKNPNAVSTSPLWASIGFQAAEKLLRTKNDLSQRRLNCPQGQFCILQIGVNLKVQKEKEILL